MTTFLRVLQEAGQHAAEAVEHAAEPVQNGAEQAAGGVPDIGGMLMHHLADAPEIELPWGVWHLPHWGDIGHIFGFPINLSPTKHVVFMAIAAVLVCLILVMAARSVQRTKGERAPGGMANAMEALIIYFRNEIVRRNIGHGADGYTPFILSLFFFILTMNLLGLVPWGASPTGNVMVTGGLALVSLAAIEVSGFVALGPAGYAKTIFYAPKGMGPVGTAIMLVIMTPVELVGKIAKPFALMIRLFANMTAGHTVILSLVGLIFVFGNMTGGRWAVAAGSVGMSVAMMMLEIFVAFLQAYIFAMLTSVFIGLIRHAH